MNPKVTLKDMTGHRFLTVKKGINLRLSFKKKGEKGCITFGPFTDKKEAKEFLIELKSK